MKFGYKLNEAVLISLEQSRTVCTRIHNNWRL